MREAEIVIFDLTNKVASVLFLATIFIEKFVMGAETLGQKILLFLFLGFLFFLVYTLSVKKERLKQAGDSE